MKTKKNGIIGGILNLRKARQIKKQQRQNLTNEELSLEADKSICHLLKCHKFAMSQYCHP